MKKVKQFGTRVCSIHLDNAISVSSVARQVIFHARNRVLRLLDTLTRP